jgi:hypothetical protein
MYSMGLMDVLWRMVKQVCFYLFAFRFSLFAFRFSLFAFRFSLFAFRFSLFAFLCLFEYNQNLYFHKKIS